MARPENNGWTSVKMEAEEADLMNMPTGNSYNRLTCDWGPCPETGVSRLITEYSIILSANERIIYYCSINEAWFIEQTTTRPYGWLETTRVYITANMGHGGSI